jgi:hypothetical protein
MNRFRQMGFIEYNGKLKIHTTLLNVILHDLISRRGDQLLLRYLLSAALQKLRADANEASAPGFLAISRSLTLRDRYSR